MAAHEKNTTTASTSEGTAIMNILWKLLFVTLCKSIAWFTSNSCNCINAEKYGY